MRQKYAFISIDGHSLPLAYHLQQERAEVWVGQVSDWRRIDAKHDEDREAKRRRLALYDGLLEKMDAEVLVRQLLRERDKDQWRVIVDFNFLHPYSDVLRRAGFKGLLPHEEDEELEKDRRKAKQTVEQRYDMLTVGDYQEFKKVKDGEALLKRKSDQLFVLKGFNEQAKTIVPKSDDPGVNHAMILDALHRWQREYESDGFLLEEKVSDLIEFTPSAESFDGELLGVNIDIEHKLMGSRNGQQVGCGIDLVVWQDLNSKVYECFLEPLSDLMLRENELTIWDASVLYSPSKQKFFFGEYCSDRWGFNAIFSELATIGSTTAYLDRLFSLSPLVDEDTQPIGASVRVFNLRSDEQAAGQKASGELIIADIADPDIWGWDVMRKDNQLYTVGYDKNTLVVTGAGESVKQAVAQTYRNLSRVQFDSGFSLQENDFFDRDFPANVVRRYEALMALGVIGPPEAEEEEAVEENT